MPRSPAALRGQIRASALRLFAEHGFRATSLQDIASDAGCSKASLLYHFANKDAILSELLAPVGERTAALLAGLDALTGERKARAAVSGLVDLALGHSAEFRLLFEDLPRLVADPGMHPVPDAAERLLGALAAGSPGPRARAAAGLVLGGIVMSAFGDGADRGEDMRAGLVEAALRALGLAPDPPPGT
ncbi:TetR/AcrR family transcriptional regulator [Streptomyces marincola]|uniref:TetR/AcrR family transcriptional regulator n=1 Tax=Streptomyces marincola TaxID=2878388 RepID=UPI001CF1DB6D|nr:TetR/AcrR family transcriptional regulator [Streptomyces marincola]UCM91456.1 TetR/AcrR family transcriptional regulator [Streptomyces marincola]